MSANAELAQFQKKRIESENELVSLDQKIQAMKEEMKRLEEQVATKLEEKIKAKRITFEEMEFRKKKLEKLLEEIQKDQEPSSSSNEHVSEIVERKEELPDQVMAVATVGIQHPQHVEQKESNSKEKKRGWWTQLMHDYARALAKPSDESILTK